MENKGKKALNQRAAVFLRQAALFVFVVLMGVLTVCAVIWSADNQAVNNRFSQHVELVRDGLCAGVLLSAVVLAVYLAAHALIERFGGVKLDAALGMLWLAAAAAWIFAVQMLPWVDAGKVLDGAIAFAQDDFSALHYEVSDYFNIYTYQLGLVFPLELLARLFPKADLNLLAQCVNAALGVAGAGVLAALAQELFGGKKAATAAATLYLLSLPAWLYATFVYNVNLMILLCAGGAFCFARYAHTGKIGFGAGYAVCIGLAMAAKPNAAVAAIALLICALLHGLQNRDWKIVLLAVGSLLLGRGVLSLIISWYAARGNVEFRYDITMTARLAMGMQDSLIAPGWYNGYTEMSCPPEMTLDREKAQAMADIASRLAWMRENPALTAKFYREKLLTMWLDPAYESMWMGAVSHKTGAMNGLANMVYRDDTPVHRAMMAYMNAAQNVVFGLAALGGVRLMKRKDDMAAAALPVTILGGVLYHLLFEAKAQYAYPYMVYMLPLAAVGLCALEDGLAHLMRRKKADQTKNA